MRSCLRLTWTAVGDRLCSVSSVFAAHSLLAPAAVSSARRALMISGTVSWPKHRSMALRSSPAISIGWSCGRPVQNSSMVAAMVPSRVSIAVVVLEPQLC